MTLNLDLLAAGLCGMIAVCVFSLHVVSSPKRKAWITLPEYVRRGFLVVGLMFTWRSVNFLSIAPDPMIQPGHINAEGMMATFALAYMVGACAVCYWRASFHDRQADRITWAARAAQRDARLIPLVMDRDDVPATLEKVKNAHVNADGVTSEFHFKGEDELR